jgi:hypothetical protein
MKILLIGDYSGFFKNLKEGLVSLGHQVNIATSGDGFKQTSKSDINFPNFANNYEKLKFLFKGIKEYRNYDVVQIINHNIFGGLIINYNYYVLKKN